MSKDNLQLPKTAFSMKASLPTKEPLILEKWERNHMSMWHDQWFLSKPLYSRWFVFDDFILWWFQIKTSSESETEQISYTWIRIREKLQIFFWDICTWKTMAWQWLQESFILRFKQFQFVWIQQWMQK